MNLVHEIVAFPQIRDNSSNVKSKCSKLHLNYVKHIALRRDTISLALNRTSRRPNTGGGMYSSLEPNFMAPNFLASSGAESETI